ncbi:MAG: hypothetical protein Q9164_003592, partial [Protoblastenia rupestris]
MAVTSASNALKVQATVPSNDIGGKIAAKNGDNASGPFVNPAPLSDRLELFRNEDSQRVDKPLKIDPNSTYINTLKTFKFC